jgi:hypothetical protein
MGEVAISRMRDPWWRAWWRLPDAVRTGESGYVLANGRSMYEDLRNDQDAAASFNAVIASGTEEYAASLVRSLDFTDVRHFRRRRRWPGKNAGCATDSRARSPWTAV